MYPGKGPGPASVVGGASSLADLVAISPLEFETAVIAAVAVDRGLDRVIARFDHACTAHAGDTAIVGDARRNAVFQPANGDPRGVARIVEAPRPTAPVPFAHKRTFRRIARGHRQTHVIATRPIKIGLGEGRFRGRCRCNKSERHQTRPEQAAYPHSRCFQVIGLTRILRIVI